MKNKPLWPWSTWQQSSPEIAGLLYFNWKPSGTVRFRIATGILSFRIQWGAQVTWPSKQLSLLWATTHDPPREKLLSVNNAYYSFSQFSCIEAHKVYVSASGISKPARQPMTFRCLWTNTAGPTAMLRSGLGRWLDWASWAVVILRSVRAITRTSVLCVSRTPAGKPLCYSRSCSTQWFNNWPFFLLTCIPQEAVRRNVCSWVFISSRFSLSIVLLSVKICVSGWKIFFLRLSEIFCRKSLKWSYLISFLGIFPPWSLPLINPVSSSISLFPGINKGQVK